MKVYHSLIYLLIFYSFLYAQEPSSEQEVQALIFPEKPLPVKVQIFFYLVSLNKIDEVAGTFDASAYVRLKWHDSRLKFTPQPGESDQKIFVGNEAVEAEFDKIWSPALEFENATNQEITNKTLLIKSNGNVEYLVGLNATFRSPLDFHLYPFDTQNLVIKIDSFVWADNVMEFVEEKDQEPFFKSQVKRFNDFRVVNINEEIVSPFVVENAQKYSTYTATITLQRDPSFAIHQFIVPMILLFGLTCSAFFLEESNLGSRIWLITTTMLAFIATKYTIRSTLPRIGYMTILDLLFFIFYVFGGLAVIISVIESILDKYHGPLQHKVDRIIWWALPLVFLIVCVIVIFFGIS